MVKQQPMAIEMKEIYEMEESLYIQSDRITCMYIAYILKYVSDLSSACIFGIL